MASRRSERIERAKRDQFVGIALRAWESDSDPDTRMAAAFVRQAITAYEMQDTGRIAESLRLAAISMNRAVDWK